MTLRYSTRNKGAWITGAILEFVAALLLLLPFIGLSFVSFGIMSGGISPFIALIGSFAGMSLASGGIVVVLILYILLFTAVLVLSILTGIMALVNKKYFAPIINAVVYGVFCMLWIIVAIVGASSSSQILSLMASANSELGYLFRGGVSILPTLWLFLALACAVVPAFLLRSNKAELEEEKRRREEEERMKNQTVPVTDEWGTSTIPASKPNRQGVAIQVRYSDDSGTHVVKRQIMTDRPLTVGRSDSCSVVLADNRASSVHARLKYDDLNGLVIEDNNSTNGIQVNGETVMKLRKISREDSIRIGDSKLQFTVVGTLDDFDGEKTIAAGDRYLEPIRIRLNFTDDSGPRVENVILKESIMIGSMRECEVSIDSTTVSHKHARLINRGSGKVVIEDNASTNGIVVNGERVEKSSPIAKGDVITLGDVNIRVTM